MIDKRDFLYKDVGSLFETQGVHSLLTTHILLLKNEQNNRIGLVLGK